MHAIFGGWFLLPLLWMIYDWNRTWERLVAKGTQQGYGVHGSATAGVVFMGFWLLLLSILGADVPARLPLRPVKTSPSVQTDLLLLQT